MANVTQKRANVVGNYDTSKKSFEIKIDRRELNVDDFAKAIDAFSKEFSSFIKLKNYSSKNTYSLRICDFDAGRLIIKLVVGISTGADSGIADKILDLFLEDIYESCSKRMKKFVEHLTLKFRNRNGKEHRIDRHTIGENEQNAKDMSRTKESSKNETAKSKEASQYLDNILSGKKSKKRQKNNKRGSRR